jgi:hypothetical protein
MKSSEAVRLGSLAVAARAPSDHGADDGGHGEDHLVGPEGSELDPLAPESGGDGAEVVGRGVDGRAVGRGPGGSRAGLVEAPYRNTSLFFEVKSLVDEPRDLTEFEMGNPRFGWRRSVPAAIATGYFSSRLYWSLKRGESSCCRARSRRRAQVASKSSAVGFDTDFTSHSAISRQRGARRQLVVGRAASDGSSRSSAAERLRPGIPQCVSSRAHVASHATTGVRCPEAGSVRSTVHTVQIPGPWHTSHVGGSSGGPLAAPGVWCRGRGSPEEGSMSVMFVRSARRSPEHVSSSRPSPTAAQMTSTSVGSKGAGGV